MAAGTVGHTLTIRPGTVDEVGAVTSLINAAFAVERFFKAGDRTTDVAVRDMLARGALLVAETDEGTLVGCVRTEVTGDRLYVGMLSVDPSRQGRGIGRTLMDAAEDRGRASGCTTSDITVVNLRTELFPYYRKLGYVEAGTAPFDPEAPTTRECHFVIMTKNLRM